LTLYARQLDIGVCVTFAIHNQSFQGNS